jgi:hypothetical protein
VLRLHTQVFPSRAMRWVLQSLNRGDSCVFKLENEEVWAVEKSSEGEPAQKKRQRLDGRNYRIDITRPKVIATYQNHMGWVDRHNCFRQDILGLHVIWKTKRWQTHVQIEIIAMALVDALLIARKFIPKWRNWMPNLLSSGFSAKSYPPLPIPMRL